MRTFILPPTDGRKTLNDHYVIETDEVARLINYNTEVATFDKIENKIILNDDSFYSAATLRRLKHFLKYYGFKAETKKQIQKDYQMVS